MTIKEMSPAVREMIIEESNYRDEVGTCRTCKYSVYNRPSSPYCKRYEPLGIFVISNEGTCDGYDLEDYDG